MDREIYTLHGDLALKALKNFSILICRWDKGFGACHLSDLPNKALTLPHRAFTFNFENNALPYGRDNIMKLDVVQSGCLNAVAFWFDLQLDDTCSITSGTLSCLLQS